MFRNKRPFLVSVQGVEKDGFIEVIANAIGGWFGKVVVLGSKQIRNVVFTVRFTLQILNLSIHFAHFSWFFKSDPFYLLFLYG